MILLNLALKDQKGNYKVQNQILTQMMARFLKIKDSKCIYMKIIKAKNMMYLDIKKSRKRKFRLGHLEVATRGK